MYTDTCRIDRNYKLRRFAGGHSIIMNITHTHEHKRHAAVLSSSSDALYIIH